MRSSSRFSISTADMLLDLAVVAVAVAVDARVDYRRALFKCRKRIMGGVGKATAQTLDVFGLGRLPRMMSLRG